MPVLVVLIVSIAAFVGHVVLWVTLVNRSHAYAWPRKLVDLFTLLAVLLFLVGFWPLAQFAAGSTSTWPYRLPDWLVNSYAWTCAAIALLSVVHSGWRWLHPERRGGFANRRTMPMQLATASPAGMLAPGVPSLLGALPTNQVLAPVLVEMDLLVPNLPGAFDGLRIAHLSDLHMSGRIQRSYFDAIVEQTNALGADVIALTGDLVERPACLDWIDTSLARLRAKHAKFFVLGNHDLMCDPPEARKRLVACGFTDVGGRAMEIELAGGKCLVAGNEAPWFPPVPDLTQWTSANSDPGMLRLALLHTPDHFAWTQQHNFHVALAGHVHGGQIRFPLLGALVAPSKFGTRYACGVFQSGPTVMHVSPGTSCMTPIRWNCPPELALLTLRPAQAG